MDVYVHIFDEFLGQLTPDQLSYTFIQQDGATCHMSAWSFV
jgi:hypothetical protein